MKKIALITALVTSVAAPAFAQSALELAVENHNMSANRQSDQIMVSPADITLGTTVSTRGDAARAQAIANYNASADSASDRIDGRFVTVFASEPGHAADIFAQLAAESREDN